MIVIICVVLWSLNVVPAAGTCVKVIAADNAQLSLVVTSFVKSAMLISQSSSNIKTLSPGQVTVGASSSWMLTLKVQRVVFPLPSSAVKVISVSVLCPDKTVPGAGVCNREMSAPLVQLSVGIVELV